MSEVLPLALTMMIGPQIITAIILITSKNPISSSLGYICGVALAATTGTLLFLLLASLFDLTGPGGSEPSDAALYIQTGLVLLLIFMSIKTYINRKTVELPSWMKSLQNSTFKSAFKTALLLIYIMPTDILAMSAVGINLASKSSDAVKLLPFLALTVFIASVPLLAYVIFRKKAAGRMPKVRRWMETNSWIVSIAANTLFLYLLWP